MKLVLLTGGGPTVFSRVSNQVFKSFTQAMLFTNFPAMGCGLISTTGCCIFQFQLENEFISSGGN
jgi:hypothetical protein